jgi:uncharacterized NAD(P)/FAD-binding protein YdhS
VLALGNFPSADPSLKNRAFHQSIRYLVDPWSDETRAKLSENGEVLVLGSGLTALDLLMSLSHSKPSGTIQVLSRRGLFPRSPRFECKRKISLLGSCGNTGSKRELRKKTWFPIRLRLSDLTGSRVSRLECAQRVHGRTSPLIRRGVARDAREQPTT